MRVILIFILLPILAKSQYLGTASVTQGLATITLQNIYTCTGGRVCNLGTIAASDNSIWTVPAAFNFLSPQFPASSDLHNACVGANFANSSAALAALSGSDIVTIDSTGELITAFIFADNYFELYINGIAVGKDNVPYTQFNSSIIRFRVKRPFCIAMLLVDWEENLGLGSENNSGFSYYDGDGGMVAVFKDSSNNTIAKTGSNWKAQTFYTAPIISLNCPTEIGNQRLSTNCSTASTNNGSAYYGLHWSKPINWMSNPFNDSIFPNAVTYSNATVGVNNKPAYTNFSNIFDDPNQDAEFIWSSNLILDNEVIVRYTVPSITSIQENKPCKKQFLISPNPAQGLVRLSLECGLKPDEISKLSITNNMGKQVYISNRYAPEISVDALPKGIYAITVFVEKNPITQKLIVY